MLETNYCDGIDESPTNRNQAVENLLQTNRQNYRVSNIPQKTNANLVKGSIRALVDLGGGVPGERLPIGPNSFVFAYIFTKKCPCRRSTPP